MKTKFIKKILFVLLYVALFMPSILIAQDTVSLSFSDFKSQVIIWLPTKWKFSTTEAAEWKENNFDDSMWAKADTRIPNELDLPKDYKGKGWFRYNFKIDSTLFNKQACINVWHTGNIEIYLNGRLIYENNRLEKEDKKILPMPFVFGNSKNQIFAVKYSYDKTKLIKDYNDDSGFAIGLGDYENILKRQLERIESVESRKSILITITLVLGVFHLFLYFFQKKKKHNLYYVMFLLSFSVFIYINYYSYYSYSMEEILFFRRIVILILLLTIYSGAITIYSIYKRPSLYFKILLGVSLAVGIASYFFINAVLWITAYLLIIVMSVYGSWKLFSPNNNIKLNEKILRYGFMFMGIAGVIQMLMSLNILPVIEEISDPYIYGVLVFIFSMSIAFAYDFALTSRNLEKKLEEVKLLSEKAIEQERLVQEQELQRKLLAADNSRKTKELEEARKLQLSMLPACANDIPGLDICFDMKTATEVGGDYYDYFISNDGTLNIAIGDATGHGTKAGLMVATIKSLFNALGAKMMIPDFFNRCTEIIKTMNLGNLFMSMTVVRYKNNRLIASAAGMPPILIYKKSENVIDEILIKSMPLGGHRDFKYYEEEYELESGDVILMMTDGLPELFNEKREMFGYEKVKDLLKLHNEKTATGINNELFKAAENWRGSRAQDDDVTFVIIKIQPVR